MTKCPQENCTEVDDMKRTLYGQDGTGGLVACSKRLNRIKVSWKQAGATIGIIMLVLGGTYLKVDWGHAENVRKVEIHCDENQKRIQTFSVNQAVIADRVKSIDNNIIDMEKQRKEDIKTIHSRITKVQETILKAILDIKK